MISLGGGLSGKSSLFLSETLTCHISSEFGIPAFPTLDTIKYWMDGAPESQWHSQSRLMIQHNRAGLHERRFAVLMNDNFRITGNLER